jgi:type I restriction enzyme R subunit
MQLYRQMVEETLEQLFETSPVLQKIRRGESVSNQTWTRLVSLTLTQNPDVNLELLREFFPDAQPHRWTSSSVNHCWNGTEVVEQRFASFARRFAENSRQTLFLRLLKNHIQKYGVITIDKLYEDPFTAIASDGLDGVFANEDHIDELINIIQTFQPQSGATTA